MMMVKKATCRPLQYGLALAAGALVLFLPDFVYASVDTPVGNVFCTIVGWATGNTGKGLATIGIVIISIGPLLGKVSWGAAMIVALGIALVFGGGQVVNALNVSGMPGGCNTTSPWPR